MVSKERMMRAFYRQAADHVPVCPDISFMVPLKLTGRPFYEFFLNGGSQAGWGSEACGRAYVDAAKHFGIDGWYIYGTLREIRPPNAPQFTEEINESEGKKIVRRICHTPKGVLDGEEHYFADDPPLRTTRRCERRSPLKT